MPESAAERELNKRLDLYDERLRYCEQESRVASENFKHVAQTYSDADDKIDALAERLDRLDQRLSQINDTLREAVEKLDRAQANDRAEAKLMDQAHGAHIATILSRLESTKTDVNDLEHKVEAAASARALDELKAQVATKTSPGEVGAILDHKVLLLLIALMTATPPFLIEFLKQVGWLHATK